MNQVRIATTVALMILCAALTGCSSKKDKAEQAPQASPPLQAASSSARKAAEAGAAAAKKGVLIVPAKDEEESSKLKIKVLELLMKNDFAAIYKDASEGFRKVGAEKDFVALWQKQLQQTGAFKEAKEVSQAIRPEDKALAIIFKVQYEKASKSLRLIFGRNKDGKMELIGINQRDPK